MTEAQQVSGGQPTGIVTTIGERCKRCYTCVRHCPAKAIMVQDGRAQVLPERCVACGNCIRVCSQHAKRVISDDLAVTKAFIVAGEHVVACLAPSFPASFPDIRPLQLVAAAHQLGFAQVMEVAVGAELVARAYRALVAKEEGSNHLIATACPALVSYIEKHLPDLIPYLAPLVSPMVALGGLIKQRLHPNARVVFIGPCLAKKVEACDPCLGEVVDAVLTFQEFSEWLEEEGLTPADLPEREFNGPHPTVGRIFPVPGGLLRTSELQADLLDDKVVVTEGVERITSLLEQIQAGAVDSHFFDLLFCEGCINGPFAGEGASSVAGKQRVAQYTREAIARGANGSLDAYFDLDLSRGFTDCRIDTKEPTEEELRAILAQIDKFSSEDELNCGSCGYASCRDKARAVFNGLAESEMCLPYLIEKLERTVTELHDSRRDLLEAEEQLIHTEKLASMGQLAAGVAHEINNPLGTVLIYAHMLLKNLPLTDPRRQDLLLITREADRCRNIVRGLLDFSRQSKLRDELTDINTLLRNTTEPLTRREAFSNIELTMALQPDLPRTMVDSEQLRQAFINITQNAVEAMPEGGRLEIRTSVTGEGKSIAIRFSDTGIGMPQEHLERIFDPFFTTKQIGKGTGLGLAIVYGIVKMHRGAIAVDSKPGYGATFTITLPVRTSPAEALLT